MKNKLFLLMFISSSFLFADVVKIDQSINKKNETNDTKKIEFGVKTKVDGGYIIFEDNEKSKNIFKLPENKNIKEVDLVKMPKSYSKKCISCHGEKGNLIPKTKLGKSIYIAGMSKIRIIKKLSMYKNGSYSLGNGNIMQEIMKNVSDEEIKEIGLYISQQEKIKEKKKLIGPKLKKDDNVSLERID